MENSRVAIIGAGVAGLCAARQLIAAGFDCTLFERNDTPGGVWSDGYLNFGVQVQRELYEFPDWPLPADTPDFTPGPTIHRYLLDYADHFGITPHIRLGTRVTRLGASDSGDQTWIVESNDGTQTRQEVFDLVLVCIGLYSNAPNVPQIPGHEGFSGEIMHNSALKTDDQLSGKRVAVVGYGKSATDAALESCRLADSTHLVLREPHWPIPRKLAGIIPFKWGLLNRLCSTLIPPYQNPTRLEKIIHGVGKPLPWLFWRIVELLFWLQCRLGPGLGSRVRLAPERRIEIDAFGESTQVPKPEFFRLARNGRIQLQHSVVERFTEHGPVLANGQKLDVDTVIFATGWKTDFSFIDRDIWERLEPGDDGFYLYRHIVPARVPGLFFIGRASSISSILTYSLQSRWLVDVLCDRVQLPTEEHMAQNVAQMRSWKQSWMPFSAARSARLIAHTQHYHDELLEDMGLNPKRKTGLLAPLKEVIFPYQPSDYASVVAGDE